MSRNVSNEPPFLAQLGAGRVAIMGRVSQSSFGKTHADYGCIFNLMSIVWAWYFDSFRTYRFDVIG
jgi:drug/metabolite transporter superfamily protein YnfA